MMRNFAVARGRRWHPRRAGEKDDEGPARVTKPRHDAAYFAPLSQWRQHRETRLYLGLLHSDDQRGDAARITVARRVAAESACALGLGHARDLATVHGRSRCR